MGIFQYRIVEYIIFIDGHPVEKIRAPLVSVSLVHLQDTGVRNLCLAGQPQFSLPDPIEAIF